MSSRRIVARRPATLQRRMAGAAVVTVTAINDAGNVVLDAVEADGPDDGLFSVDLLAEDLPDPDLLTVTWSAENGWVETGQVAVDGDVYTAPDRLIDGRPSAAQRTTAELQRIIDEVVERVERFVGIAYVRRYHVLSQSFWHGGGSVVMKYPYPRLRRVQVNGEVRDPDTITVNDSGVLYAPWDATSIRLGYEYGLQSPPDHVVGAIEDTVEQLAAERFSQRGMTPSRAEYSGDNMSWIINNPDPKRGRLFGINRVDGVFALERAAWQRVAVG